MNDRRAILAMVLATAAITYLLRALPLAIFRKPFKSRFAADFLDALPYALLSAMILPDIFYSVGDASYPATPTLPSAAGAATALLLGFLGKSLPVVALAATAVAYICSLCLN